MILKTVERKILKRLASQSYMIWYTISSRTTTPNIEIILKTIKRKIRKRLLSQFCIIWFDIQYLIELLHQISKQFLNPQKGKYSKGSHLILVWFDLIYFDLIWYDLMWSDIVIIRTISSRKKSSQSSTHTEGREEGRVHSRMTTLAYISVCLSVLSAFSESRPQKKQKKGKKAKKRRGKKTPHAPPDAKKFIEWVIDWLINQARFWITVLGNRNREAEWEWAILVIDNKAMDRSWDLNFPLR